MSNHQDPLRDPHTLREIRQTILNLQGENLASSHPALSAEAQKAVDRIIEIRLRALEGNERYAATRFFEAIQKIPVVFNSAVESIIELAMRPGCTLAELIEKVWNRSGNSQAGQQRSIDNFIDEWGYAHLPSDIRGLPTDELSESEQALIPLDLVKAARNFEQNLREALQQWDSVTGDLRREFLDDWCAIMNHRYEFELSGTITIDPPEESL